MYRVSRREMLARSALGAAWFAALGIPEDLWALQDDEELVTFTDYTPEFKIDAQAANPTVRCYDLRKLTSWTTPNDELYAFHQTTTPKVDPSTFRLRIAGFVDKPRSSRSISCARAPTSAKIRSRWSARATRRGPRA